MVNLYLNIGLMTITVILIVYGARSFAKKDTIGFNLGHTFAGCLFVVWSYALNYFSRDAQLSEIFCCFEHAFTDWTLLFMTRYFLAMGENKQVKKVQRIVSDAIISCDTVVLLTNPINHLAFEFRTRSNDYGSYTQAVPKALFYVHCAICIIMLATMVSLMVKKILKSASFYKLRYESILATLIVIMVFNAIFYLTKTAVFDYSRVFYGIGALIFFFATYDYSPYGLMKIVQTYIDDNITDAVVAYDTFGKLLKKNILAGRMFSKEILIRKEKLEEALGEEVKEGKFEKELNGRYYSVTYKKLYDRHENFIASVFILSDITESKIRVEREHRAAIYDPLTNTFNRLGFVEEAPKFLAERNVTGGYAYMVSGICNFKGINGLYGTKVGDRVLIEIAKKFNDFQHVFPMIYGRTAEGKYSCILPFEYVDEIVNEMSRITINIDDGISIHVDMCHGFVVMQDMDKPIEYYYELSLLALARCKKQMSSPVLEYSRNMAEEQQRKQLLLAEMHESLANREFFIELQPQIDLKNNRVEGAEALVRWNHPTLGRISPAEFVPLFESNGFITKIDTFVWREAAKTIRRFTESGIYKGSISVNVSQIDIMCMNVAEEFERIVTEEGIPASKLHVEITESACVNNRDSLIGTIESLRSKGFIVEIDDFGSGYSSLNALMHIPFDIVKLDMMFMKQAEKNTEKADVIVSAVAEMIHNLKASIIVEGVETDENVATVKHICADAVQGYHYSKPISVEKFIDYVKNYD